MRVIVAEDSGFFREALVSSLQSSGIDVVGSTATADDVYELVQSHKPDVAVLDICLPPTKTDEGLKLAEMLAKEFPETGVLLLSAYLSTPHVSRVLATRRKNIGCLAKDQLHDADVLLRAVESVGRGELFIDPEFIEQKLHARAMENLLTIREMDFLQGVAEGLSNKTISDRLHVNIKTVERSLTTVFRKLEIDSSEGNARVQAVLRFISRPQSFIQELGDK